MRVKVGNRWFEAEHGQPIAVELTAGEREIIARMGPDEHRVGCNADLQRSPAELRAWLADD